MGLTIVRKEDGTVIDWTSDGSVRFDERYFDHIESDEDPRLSKQQVVDKDKNVAIVYKQDIREHIHYDIGHSITVLQGSVSVITKNEKQILTKFQTIFIPINVSHSVHILSSDTIFVNVQGNF